METTIRVHINEDGVGDTDGMDVEASLAAYENAVMEALSAAYPAYRIITDRQQAMSSVEVSTADGSEDFDLLIGAEDIVGQIFADGDFWVPIGQHHK